MQESGEVRSPSFVLGIHRVNLNSQRPFYVTVNRKERI